jgi:hypothetical protein
MNFNQYQQRPKADLGQQQQPKHQGEQPDLNAKRVVGARAMWMGLRMLGVSKEAITEV